MWSPKLNKYNTIFSRLVHMSYIYIYIYIYTYTCPVGWDCKIHQLFLCKGVRLPPQRMSWYDTKQSDGEVPVMMLELWGMRSTPSLPALPGPLWLRVVATDRVLSMGQVELTCVLMLNWIAWNRTVLTFKLCTHAEMNCLK